MNNKFLKVNLGIFKYLLFASPVSLAAVMWALLFSNNEFTLQSTIYDLLGWHFIIWFILLVYLIFTLFFSVQTREEILAKLTLSQVRDEREFFISGSASRGTFFSTLAALILLLFVSCLNIDIYRSKVPGPNGKKGKITIGYHFALTKEATTVSMGDKVLAEEERERTIFKMNGIPFTQESILLFLLIYHIAGYKVFSMRRQRQDCL